MYSTLLTSVSCSAILILLIQMHLQQPSTCAHTNVHAHHHLPVEKELFQDKSEQMNTPKNQKLTLRSKSNSLLKYTSYRDVSILHFKVPQDTQHAFFTFQAFDESSGAFHRRCSPKDITLHLKASSYPVISPENITFPKNFLSSDQRFKIYSLQFQSNEEQQSIAVEGPQVGNWFAVAFISWTDPNNDRIEQQGLGSSCETILLAELLVSSIDPTIINNGQEHYGNLTSSKNAPNGTKSLDNVESSTDKKSNATIKNPEIIYKFYVPANVALATARILFEQVCDVCPDVAFRVQSNAYPSTAPSGSEKGNEYNYLHSTLIKPNQTSEISVAFFVQPNTWHYAVLTFAKELDNKGSATKADNGGKLKVGQNGRQRLRRQGKEYEYMDHNLSYSLQIDFQYESQPHNHKTELMTSKGSNSSGNHEPWTPVPFRGIEYYELLRQTYHEFFMFDYDLEPDSNGTVPSLLNLTAGTPVGFAFELGEVYDIGGTLTIAVSMRHAFNEFKTSLPVPSTERAGGILAERLVSGPNASKLPTAELLPSNQTLVICIHLNEPGMPTWPDKCRFGQRLMPASSIVNNTDLSNSMGLVHIPFPESGRWYVTMGLYCHGADTARVTIIDSVKDFIRQHVTLLHDMQLPCACALVAKDLETCINSSDCLSSMNETETLKVKECLTDFKCTNDFVNMTRRFELHHKAATEQHFALDNCNSSVVFSISSSPCVVGRCGRFGRCYHYMSGGFVFSTCVCMKGYRGWDCTEDSQVLSGMFILLASLMLTLSNLLLLPSIYIAVRRHYYTEAIIYFFAMIFSIFYHACDSGEDEYSFCLVQIGVLQFCDFYCGLLAIWVTLVAMAHMRQQFTSLLHILGAILLAFGTELNKQSLWVFLVPALVGIFLILLSWGQRCFKTHELFPARRYLFVFMPLGALLVLVGLSCYAFLQTKQNYHIVHSIWHMVMALSILFLLPSRKYFVPKD